MQTKEEYTTSTLTTIRDNFRVYDSIESGVNGYFDFINYSRYSDLKGATSSRDYIERIKNDGYATSSTYVNTVYNIVKQYNLEKRFDNMTSTELTNEMTGAEIIDKLARDVINGKYGNGAERKNKLGLLYDLVQKKVNELL
jgi:flagellum-specific peptidoglycan hydrolase FlgJ